MPLPEQAEFQLRDLPISRAKRSSRTLIMDAARECFARFGYGKTTIADIAAGAGLTRRTIYQHYADKEALWRAIVDDAAEQIGCALCVRARSCTSVEDRLRVLLLSVPALFNTHALDNFERPRVALHAGRVVIDGFHGAVWGPVADLLLADGALAADIDRDELIAWLTLTGSAMLVESALKGLDEVALRRMAPEMMVAPLLPASRTIQPVTDIIAYRAVPVGLGSLRADRSGGPSVRDRIVEAALLRLSRPGGQEATIADVAADAHIDRRTVYRHFADRKALIEEVTLLEAQRVNSQIRRLLVRRPDPADIIADGILLSIRVFDASPLKEQLVAGTDFIASASDRERKIFPFVRLQWMQILQRMTELRHTNSRINVDSMAGWILLMQHVLHRSLDLTASDDAGIRHFVRRFLVDALITESCARTGQSEGHET